MFDTLVQGLDVPTKVGRRYNALDNYIR